MTKPGMNQGLEVQEGYLVKLGGAHDKSIKTNHRYNPVAVLYNCICRAFASF